jgi:Flp pilus assembly protein TadD
MSDTQLVSAQLFAQGRLARINGDYDQAISLLQCAITETPHLACAHMELGLAYCFTGLFDESIAELVAAAALESTSAEIYLHLAKTYTMLGMYEEGETAFNTVLTLARADDPLHAEALKQLAYFRRA